MCGILGYYNLDREPVRRTDAEVLALRDMMRNRGPDACGLGAGANREWLLAHRRLSIIDLSERGHQPMSTPDGRIHVCYNGEIYNYRELREGLDREGVSFRSTSDTEVILELYRKYGTDCFRMLDGMFALIIVDEGRQRAVIARDPVGKKPLYYAVLGRNLVIASDPGVISRDREYTRAVSVDGLYSTLAMGGVIAPHSLFKDIYKLEPGSYRVVDQSFEPAGASTRYFDFALTPRTDLVGGEEAVDVLDRLLDRAVEKRMISDVPFGVFLSGGIDSALIVHYMSRHTDRVNTFSVDVTHSDSSKRETHTAAALAERYRTNHQSIQLDTEEYIRILDEVVLPNSTLGMTESVLIAKLSEAARANGVIVVETGEGADELFMGYGGYLSYLDGGCAKMDRLRRAGPMVSVCARLARAIAPATERNRLAYLTDNLEAAASGAILKDFLYEPFLSYQAERVVWNRHHTRARATKFEMLNDRISARVDRPADYSRSALSVLWNASFRWADLLLNRIDNFTMTSGVEGRAPMLDVDVMNFALSLSDRLKERNGSPKYALRKLVERHISKEHAALPKIGFGGGGSNLVNERVRGYLEGKLRASASYREDPLLAAERLDDGFQLLTLTAYHVWVDTWM